MRWIDGTYELGYVGFIVLRSNPIRHTESVSLTQRPPYTNRSHQPKLYGWCGSWNDTNTYAEGIGCVVRVAHNGRCQIAEISARETILAYLEQQGYPDLIEQYDQRSTI